jgi:hypothetical protein
MHWQALFRSRTCSKWLFFQCLRIGRRLIATRTRRLSADEALALRISALLDSRCEVAANSTFL